MGFVENPNGGEGESVVRRYSLRQGRLVGIRPCACHRHNSTNRVVHHACRPEKSEGWKSSGQKRLAVSLAHGGNPFMLKLQVQGPPIVKPVFLTTFSISRPIFLSHELLGKVDRGLILHLELEGDAINPLPSGNGEQFLHLLCQADTYFSSFDVVRCPGLLNHTNNGLTMIFDHVRLSPWRACQCPNSRRPASRWSSG
jgi:hypothetical protein